MKYLLITLFFNLSNSNLPPLKHMVEYSNYDNCKAELKGNVIDIRANLSIKDYCIPYNNDYLLESSYGRSY